MYSFGNGMRIGEMTMQTMAGRELNPFGDDNGDDTSINDATMDVDGVMGQMQLAVDTDPYAIGQNLGLVGDSSSDGGMTDLEDSTEQDDADESNDGPMPMAYAPAAHPALAHPVRFAPNRVATATTIQALKPVVHVTPRPWWHHVFGIRRVRPTTQTGQVHAVTHAHPRPFTGRRPTRPVVHPAWAPLPLR